MQFDDGLKPDLIYVKTGRIEITFRLSEALKMKARDNSNFKANFPYEDV